MALRYGLSNTLAPLKFVSVGEISSKDCSWDSVLGGGVAGSISSCSLPLAMGRSSNHDTIRSIFSSSGIVFIGLLGRDMAYTVAEFKVGKERTRDLSVRGYIGAVFAAIVRDERA